jgi:hypothetical protein
MLYSNNRKAEQTVLAMLKDVDDKPVEPARKKAERRWNNYDVEKRFKEEMAKPLDPNPVAKELEIAEVISREKPDGRGSVVRAQTKFAKYIRDMLDDHKRENDRRNQIIYALSIRRQRYRLLKEKLRRLELREAQRVAASQYPQQNQGGRRDLFS